MSSPLRPGKSDQESNYSQLGLTLALGIVAAVWIYTKVVKNKDPSNKRMEEERKDHEMEETKDQQPQQQPLVDQNQNHDMMVVDDNAPVELLQQQVQEHLQFGDDVAGPNNGRQESAEGGESEQEEIEDFANHENVLQPSDFGCKHYLRACQLQCPDPICKGAFHTCRLCHDEVHFENEMDPKKNHQLNRHKVTHVKCLRCTTEQPKSKTCIKCHKDFSKYFCEICSLYDDKGPDKGVYHCEKCGICRVGGRASFFHCDNCGCCLGKALENNHQCVNQRLKQDCVVCMSAMHDSRQGASFLRCGHAMHTACYQQIIKTTIACPLCRKSFVDPKLYETFYDQQIAEMPMPDEYKDKLMTVQCNDCLVKSNVPFHIMGGKCKDCRSYNTTRVGDELIDDKDKISAADENAAVHEVVQAEEEQAAAVGDNDWETDNEDEEAEVQVVNANENNQEPDQNQAQQPQPEGVGNQEEEKKESMDELD